MSDTPSGDPKPTDGKPHDSEAPTQLWQSPFRHLSQFPTRRAARRRERLEALLKGQEITNTGLLTATSMTHTAANGDVSPLPLPGNGLPEVAPPPESIPTGTYTSIRPVSGPRLAVFVAVGVAVGGLAALQLNRVLTPRDNINLKHTTATMAPAVVVAAPPAVGLAPPLVIAAAAVTDAFEAAGCELAEPPIAAVPPLQVEIVAARPMARASRPSVALAGTAEQEEARAAADVASALVNTDPAAQASCSRYPSVHIPTQLHPRINPLMTSNQVFTEQGVANSTRQVPPR